MSTAPRFHRGCSVSSHVYLFEAIPIWSIVFGFSFLQNNVDKQRRQPPQLTCTKLTGGAILRWLGLSTSGVWVRNYWTHHWRRANGDSANMEYTGLESRLGWTSVFACRTPATCLHLLFPLFWPQLMVQRFLLCWTT